MTLERPDGGRIEIGGDPLWSMSRDGGGVPADAAHVRKVRSHVGMVFQHFNLFRHMTALGNCTEAPIRVLRLRRDEAVE